MKTLETMNILEVLEKVGFVIQVRDLGTCISNQKILSEFASKEDTIEKNVSNLMDFIQKNEKYINKERLILNAIYNCNKILQEIKEGKTRVNLVEEKPKNLYKYIENGKKLLGEKNKTKIIRLEENKKGKIELTYIQSKDFFIANEKNGKKKIKQIEEKIPLEDILRDMHVEDIHFFVEENALATGLMTKIIYNSIDNKSRIPERRNLISEDKMVEYSQKVSFEEVREEYISAIKDYATYIDFDKLMLMSAFRTIYRLENEECGEKETKEAKQKLDRLEELLQKRKNNIEISGPIYIKDNAEENGIVTQLVKFSKNNFKELKEKYFYKNKFYKGKELEKLEKDLLNGNVNLKDIDINVCKMIELDKKKIRFLMQKDDYNCIYLLKHNLITSKEVIEHIKENGMSNELTEYLYENGELNHNMMIKLYEEGKISVSSIGNLKKNENIQELLSNKDIIDIYDEERNKEDKTKLQKYALLYRELKVKDKSEEELREQANVFLLEMDEKFDQEDLKPLYKLGIIPIETALEWGGQGIAIEMLKEGMLKPSDTKELFKNGMITMREIENILQSIGLNNTQKLDIIYSTFDETEQDDIRSRLIQLLDVEKIQREKNGNPVELRTRQIGEGKNRRAYRTDPCLRYKLIDILDEDYEKELLLDGHIVFHLPNLNGGTYIIEKMFKDTKQGIKPDYGRATYILNEENYVKNKKEIIDSDIINRQFLTGLKEEKETLALNHSSRWGENLIRELGINKSNSRYKEADLQEIDTLIKAIERSRREIE